MIDQFKIYVEQLRNGETENLQETLSPDFLEVQERDLSFPDPVLIEGEAYQADEMLVLHLDITTTGLIPCIICNEPVKVEIVVPGFYHAVPLDEIKSGIYDFRDILRETIVLEAPSLAECCQGKCPQRSELKKFLKKASSSKGLDEEGYHPFARLGDDQSTVL